MGYDKTHWKRDLAIFMATVFMAQLGLGIHSGVSTNFLVQEMGLEGKEVLWLTGFREIPGLLLIFLAALMVKLPLSRRTAVSLVLMAIGYGGYGLSRSYTFLVATALISSVGFHNWMPLQNSLGLSLVPKEESGSILGRISAVGAVASLGGMLLITLLVNTVGLRVFYGVAFVVFLIGAAIMMQLPTTVGHGDGGSNDKIVFRKRYWLYYVLIFFEGSRTQVFFAFSTWVMVEIYGLNAQTLPLLLIVSRLVNMVGSPMMGKAIDRFGERAVLVTCYAGLAAGFISYAMAQSIWALAAIYVVINFLVISRVALSSYVNRISLPGDLVPTLSAGVSVNHITSVTMSLLAGTLLSLVGYQTLSFAAAGMIALSIPFAFMVRTRSVKQSAV
jgi:predicted MFS family arabinose efflux permease